MPPLEGVSFVLITFIVPPLKESLVLSVKFHSASLCGEILCFLVFVPPFTGRVSFVYSASLGERVEFMCYLLQPFLFSSWNGVSFVLIKSSY